MSEEEATMQPSLSRLNYLLDMVIGLNKLSCIIRTLENVGVTNFSGC